jgi:pimeloyl-ACP methyl ester carboxylesterase
MAERIVPPDITTARVQANGIGLRVAGEGEGPLVILVHGWPELWYSWRHRHDAPGDRPVVRTWPGP